MSNSDPIVAQKPISLWLRPVDINFEKLFQALGKGGIDLVSSNWSEAAKDSLEFIQAMGLGEKVAETLWWLVQKSLFKAMVDLTRSHDTVLNPDRKLDLKKLSEVLDARLVVGDVTLNREFFTKPERLSIIEDLKVPYREWLQDYIVIDKSGRPITPDQEKLMIVAMAKSISDRLPTYFVYALNREWVAGKETYKILEDQFKTPFNKAEERERAWENYAAWLQRQIDEPLFGLEAFSLKQIYVKLRAYYNREKKSEKKGDETKLERVVVDLQTELEAWVNKADQRDAIRIISGAPGCGKSSFTKIFAAHISSVLNIRVLFIPLHQFEPQKDLVDALDKFIANDLDEILPPNPLKTGNKLERLLLIFDGLDELAMQGKIAAEVAQQFVIEVRDKVNRWNQNEIYLQVLISGREVVVQSNINQFRRSEQAFHILSYFEDERVWEKLEYIDSQKIFNQDQRQEWWKKYGSLTGRNYTGLPSELAEKNLTEITAQPLLNYLVALSFTSGNLDFSQENNLNGIYDDLLASIFKRDWEKRQHKAIEGTITLDQFVRILEEIAIACWHGNGRTTTVAEIESHCKDSGLEKMLEIFQEGAKVAVTKLFAAFYFRESGIKGTEKTFEFTHKSFGEYLTAKRIVLELESIQEEFTRHQTKFDRGWNEKECLKHWAMLCGLTTIDEYLFEFIKSEIRLRDLETVKSWQQTLCHLISFMLKEGMPMEELKLSYFEMNKQARNAEEALLVVLNACAQVTQIISKIEWQTPEAFGTWLNKLQPQRKEYESTLITSCLNYLDLNCCILILKELCCANLRRANLTLANLTLANLSEANLSRANLSRADLSEADLSEADLSGADLYKANLSRANLSGAALNYANLNEANLSRANLSGAPLNYANLNEANLSDANLSGANLSGANLSGANLSDANLSGANLSEADLSYANLSDANLSRAILSDANLSGANLSGANLSDANLSGANLSGANLSEADLSYANLSRAILSDADLNGANLNEANLNGANLNEANLRNILFIRTKILKKDFEKVKLIYDLSSADVILVG